MSRPDLQQRIHAQRKLRLAQGRVRARRTITRRDGVRVEVGADGVPTSVEVAQRSGSRDLDRAAVNAVRQWRFQPAQRDGQAVAGAVTVPIDFKMR